MSDRRFWRILGLIVLVAAAMRVGHIAAIHETPMWHFAEGWVTSDMHTNLNWADHLASGDWLDRETFRPKFPWQAGIASEEVWSRWLGPGVFYQPPLYAYLLALTIRATGSPDFFRVLQVLLGAANAGLVGLLGWKTAGRAAGLIAAGLAALYAPWILYDGELLRGTLALTTALLSLLALLEARRRSAAGGDAGPIWRRYRTWGAAGAALGIAYLTESAIVTFIPLALLWALFARVEAPEPERSSRKKAARKTG
ncbi:MAG TPA: hypothetical protein VNI57_10695, partial [Candidatus Saccharimonadales bacterium]|nr:hypothetical protein [Candidatus Saccharimonadales bacterium]